MPVRKTTGNSSPLAVWSVMRGDHAAVGTGAGRVAVGDLVGVGDERDALEEVLEQDLLPGLDALVVELARDLDELGEVLDAVLVLGVGAVPQFP